MNANRRSPRETRVHLGFHKCLTSYLYSCLKCGNLFDAIKPSFDRAREFSSGFYAHFQSHRYLWEKHHDKFVITSLNNVFPLELINATSVTILTRHPFDMAISGLAYHRSGKESWTRRKIEEGFQFEATTAMDLSQIPVGQSVQDYLLALPDKDALDCEISLRMPHFNACSNFLKEATPGKSNLMLLRYEDCISDQKLMVKNILQHHSIASLESNLIVGHARRTQFQQTARSNPHIQNGLAYSWKQNPLAGQLLANEPLREVCLKLGYDTEL